MKFSPSLDYPNSVGENSEAQQPESGDYCSLKIYIEFYALFTHNTMHGLYKKQETSVIE